MINNKNKNITRYSVERLKETKDTNVTLKFNGESYRLFQSIMKEQRLVVSSVLNQFMVLANDLLQDGDGGEVSFIFETNKREGSTKK